MKITVLNDDNAIGFEGVFYNGLDFSTVPDNLHALQWNDTKGEIEFYVDKEGVKPPNEKITELPNWVMPLKPQWDAADTAKKQKDADFAELNVQIETLAKNLFIGIPNSTT